MTPEQERALLEATSAGLDDALREAYAELLRLISEGVAPVDAVREVMDGFRGEFAQTMASGFSAVLEASVGATAALELVVGPLQLSARLYAESSAVALRVSAIVQEHARGFADARRLALELFEGYGFREPGAEALKMAPRNPRLPKYLREALLGDPLLEEQFARAFARIQVDKLATPALRAAYSELLNAIDEIEAGRGSVVLRNRLRVAFYERMRYFASRIAQTELHRAYMRREALLVMADADVDFVQIRRAPGRGDPCICTLFTGRDRFGLGPGVYPKARAPLPPYHPHCRCVVSPRLDLTGKTPKDEDRGADVYFLRRLSEPVAARVVGSAGKLAQVMGGRTAEEVYNANTPAAYRVRQIADVS